MNEKMHLIRSALKKELDKNRYEHTLGVMYTAGCLAMRYDIDMETAMLAGLLHDCAKCIPNEKKIELCQKNGIELTDMERKNPFLIHAKLGAFLAASQYGITDTSILHAIEVHTTGAPAMNTLDKIIFISDYMEPNRNKAANLTEIRSLAFKDLDLALRKILSDTLAYLSGNKTKENIDPMTLRTYEYYKQEAHHE